MEQGVKDTSKMTQAELDRAMAFLDKLRPNVKTFFKVGEDAQLFNSGSVAVSMGSFGTIIGKAIENNPANPPTTSATSGRRVPAARSAINETAFAAASVSTPAAR
jgi:spermidine/putrescine-binding protein